MKTGPMNSRGHTYDAIGSLVRFSFCIIRLSGGDFRRTAAVHSMAEIRARQDTSGHAVLDIRGLNIKKREPFYE